jgi:hypothetical protein
MFFPFTLKIMSNEQFLSTATYIDKHKFLEETTVQWIEFSTLILSEYKKLSIKSPYVLGMLEFRNHIRQ